MRASSTCRCRPPSTDRPPTSRPRRRGGRRARSCCARGRPTRASASARWRRPGASTRAPGSSSVPRTPRPRPRHRGHDAPRGRADGRLAGGHRRRPGRPRHHGRHGGAGQRRGGRRRRAGRCGARGDRPRGRPAAGWAPSTCPAVIWWDRPVAAHPRRIRTRLTLAFVIVLALVLGVAGYVVYRQYSAGLTTTIDQGLLQREVEVRDLARRPLTASRLVALSGERLLQIYTPEGDVVLSSRVLAGHRLLSAAQVRGAASGTLSFTTRTTVPDGVARGRAFPLPRQREGAAIGEAPARPRPDQHPPGPPLAGGPPRR